MFPLLREHFTIPYLQGTQTIESDGRTRLTMSMEIEDAELLKTAFWRAYVAESGYQTEN